MQVTSKETYTQSLSLSLTIRNTLIMRGGVSVGNNLCWPSRKQYANFDCSDWTEPGRTPTNAHATGFNPFIFVSMVSLGARLPPPAPTQLTKLTGEVSSLRSWCLSYRNPPLPLFPVLFMTSPIMVNIWNEQLIIAAMP